MKNEVCAERLRREEALTPKAWLLLPAKGWFLCAGVGVFMGSVYAAGVFSTPAWRALYPGTDATRASSISGVRLISTCFGALLMGFVMERHYRPREGIALTAPLVLVTMAILANTTEVTPWVLVVLFGFAAGSCIVILIPALPNTLPRYPALVFSTMTFFMSITGCVLIPWLNKILHDQALPLCPTPPPRHLPANYTTMPPTQGECSDEHLSKPRAFQLVLNIITSAFGLSWFFFVVAIVLDARGNQSLSRRVAGDADAAVIEQEIELDDVLVRRSTILGARGVLYGALD